MVGWGCLHVPEDLNRHKRIRPSCLRRGGAAGATRPNIALARPPTAAAYAAQARVHDHHPIAIRLMSANDIIDLIIR